MQLAGWKITGGGEVVCPSCRQTALPNPPWMRISPLPFAPGYTPLPLWIQIPLPLDADPPPPLDADPPHSGYRFNCPWTHPPPLPLDADTPPHLDVDLPWMQRRLYTKGVYPCVGGWSHGCSCIVTWDNPWPPPPWTEWQRAENITFLVSLAGGNHARWTI